MLRRFSTSHSNSGAVMYITTEYIAAGSASG